MTDLDLAAWLGRQLDDDEAAAHAAARESGIHRTSDPNWFVSMQAVSASGGVIAAGLQGEMDEPIAEHIARWDPARVLTEVAAKRAIVEDYRIVLANNAAEPDEMMALARGLIIKSLGMVLRRLAAPYAERPGFKPEWRLDA